MFVVVLTAETDGTGRSIAFLIGCLLAIAGIMTALTIWYWRFTSPKRVAERLALDLGPAQGFTLVEPVAPTMADIQSEPAETLGDGDGDGTHERTERNPQRQLAPPTGVAAIAAAVHSEEADKADSLDGSSPAWPTVSTPYGYESDGGKANSSGEDRGPLILGGVGESDSVDSSSDALPTVGRTISDEAWDRITQSMLDSYKAQKSET